MKCPLATRSRSLIAPRSRLKTFRRQVPGESGTVMHETKNERDGKLVPGIPEPWARLIQFCQELGHGEIEKLKIQDGVPVIADVVREKVKFT